MQTGVVLLSVPSGLDEMLKDIVIVFWGFLLKKTTFFTLVLDRIHLLASDCSLMADGESVSHGCLASP